MPQENTTPMLQRWLDDDGLAVSKATVTPEGFMLELTGGAVLRVNARGPHGDEMWRLFRPGRDDAHLVRYGDGRGVHE
jgi:hypothetical protein